MIVDDRLVISGDGTPELRAPVVATRGTLGRGGTEGCDGHRDSLHAMSDRPVALVTGASSGIGEHLARQLASAGHDLVLVARNRQALERLARDLQAAHGTTVEILPADLAVADGVASAVARIADGDPLDVVVNNAGFGWFGDMVDQPPAVVESLVAVDVAAVAHLSRAAVASMVPRRRGGLLNVSSTAGFVPGPHSALYHAAKAFVTSLSEALHEEALPYGVRVTALCPGYTPTGFQERANIGDRRSPMPSFAVTDASMVAASGLVALARNQAVCIPGAANRLAQVASHLVPRSVVRRMSGKVLERF